MWKYIDDPIAHVTATNGLLDQEIEGTRRSEETVQELDEALSKTRSEEVISATPDGENQWSTYSSAGAANRPPAGRTGKSGSRPTPGESEDNKEKSASKKSNDRKKKTSESVFAK